MSRFNELEKSTEKGREWKSYPTVEHPKDETQHFPSAFLLKFKSMLHEEEE